MIYTKEQIKKFITLKQGLLDKHKYVRQQGAYDFIVDRSSIQYDPVDACGKNAEIILFSRIKGFKKEMLYNLLYKERNLYDYFDKEMSIIPIKYYNLFQRRREYFKHIHQNRVIDIREKTLDVLKDKEYITSKELPSLGKIDWWWKETDASKVVLEVLYHQGDLMIHHKKGMVKHYTLSSNILKDVELFPNIEDNFEYLKHKVLSRIDSVGLLWNKSSPAFLGINLKGGLRSDVFRALLVDGKIIKINIEDLKDDFYILKEDEHLLNETLIGRKYKKRIEFLAPLDNMIWDRDLIKKIFDYEYIWEIYTPEIKRKYGYYVLPILYGCDLVGRIELIRKKNKLLYCNNIWYEKWFKPSNTFIKKLLNRIDDMKVFNDCTNIIIKNGVLT